MSKVGKGEKEEKVNNDVIRLEQAYPKSGLIWGPITALGLI